MANLKISGTFQGDHQTIKVDLSVIIFKDGGVTVYYCPALDLYGYGTTEAQADTSLQISMNEYFKYATNKGSLLDDLRALGWSVRSKSRPFTPPLLGDLLAGNADFRRIFDNHPFRKIDQRVQIPLAS